MYKTKPKPCCEIPVDHQLKFYCTAASNLAVSFFFFSTALLFNHRSVFPVLFNSAVIDYWWRLPLTFRLYFRESGQRMVIWLSNDNLFESDNNFAKSTAHILRKF